LNLPRKKAVAKKNLNTEEVMPDPAKSEATTSDPTKAERTQSPATSSQVASSSATTDAVKPLTSKQDPTSSPASQPNASDPHAASSQSKSPDAPGSDSMSQEMQSAHEGIADHEDHHARIRHRAYLNFLDRQENSHDGDPEGDWFYAEHQMREENSQRQTKPAQTPDEHRSQGVRKDDAYKSAKA
jgi:hypothetical protein